MRKEYLISIMPILFCCACHNDEPHGMQLSEFPPIEIRIAYTSLMTGEDLLNPSCTLYPNFPAYSPYIKFKGVTYELNKLSESNPNNNDSPVEFSGLKLEKYGDRYVLSFGNLDGSYLYKNEELYVNFGYYEEHSLLIYSTWTYDNNGFPLFFRKYTLPMEVDRIIQEGDKPIIEMFLMDIPIGQ